MNAGKPIHAASEHALCEERDAKWFKRVRPGDLLRPIALWNQSERRDNQLPDPVRVLRVREAPSQSGVLFAVKTLDGGERELDAAWFAKSDRTLDCESPGFS